jgi:hypothetical protein
MVPMGSAQPPFVQDRSDPRVGLNSRQLTHNLNNALLSHVSMLPGSLFLQLQLCVVTALPV